MVTRIIVIISLLLFSTLIHGQDKLCGTPEPTLAQQKRLNELVQLEKSNDLISSVAVEMSEVAILAHVIRRDDGTGGLTETQLQDALDNVNSYYSNANLSFFYLDIRYIDDSDYYDFINTDEGKLTAEYNYDGIINIYFANSVSNGQGSFYCGYAYFPGGQDVILMDNGCTMNGSTLPHEIGHFFYLYHTHGTTNTGTTDEVVIRPGEESTGCVEPDCTPTPANCETNGDRLCDTEADPNVSGAVDGECNYTENEVDVNEDPFRPDATNIMSYSTKACRNLFTSGQYNRMNTTYVNERSYLHTDKTLAAFESDDLEVCEGESISFSDNSINATSYSWTFEGGNPATSTDPNPIVMYETDGSFDVTLTVEDDEGNSNTKSFTEYVLVRGDITSDLTSATGSFEEESLEERVIGGGNDIWTQTDVGSDGDKSAYVVLVFMDNGQEDYLVMNALNTTVEKSFSLTFDYAYAALNEETTDTLEIVYRDPCGEWQSVWSKEGQELSTAPNENQVFFFPTADQWVTETIFFAVEEELDLIEVAFKTISDNGNSLFVDNYNIEAFDPVFTISDIEVTDASCSDMSDGALDIIAEGDGLFEYSIDGGETFDESSSYTNLSVGSYSVIVKNFANNEETMAVEIGYKNEYPTKPIISKANGELSVSLSEDQTIEWYYGGVLMVDETTNTISYDGSGLYSVKVSNGACGVVSDDFLVLSAGDGVVLDVEVYPNPVDDVLSFTIDKELAFKINAISISDLSGKIITEMNYEKIVDVSNLVSGIYLIHFEVQGQKITRRFLKR